MKFVKENLFVLICGVIAIAALVLRFTWVGSVQEDTRVAMQGRMDKAAQAVQLAQQSFNLPNNPKLSDYRGAVTEGVIEAKKELQSWMQKQSDEVIRMASHANQKGRVTKDHVALLNGEKLDGFLPTILPSRDPHTLKPVYDEVFGRWLSTLLYGSQSAFQKGRNYDLEGSVPTSQDINAELTQRAARDAANSPRVFGRPTEMAPTNLSKQELDERVKAALAEKAANIRMYVNRGSFQIHGWYLSSDPPREAQIFESVFDCWLQQDVVRAIDAVNGSSRSVLTSPIKRLEKIVVGAKSANDFHNAQWGGMAPGGNYTQGAAFAVDNNQLFMNQGNPKPTNQLDTTRSMTGRVGNENWDVTLMTVVVHIDPSYLNQFIEELYRQNNFYTVLDIKLEVVDPYEAASNGYMYGKVPVVRADIMVEALFFRKWMAYVMPEAMRTSMTIPAPQDQEKKP